VNKPRPDSFGGNRLSAHPQTPPRAVESAAFTFIWKGAGAWVFEFHLGVPPDLLILPAPAEPTRADELWKHTCCELFLLNPADGSYLEFNFSPSGRWAAYHFDAYREGMRKFEVQRPCIFTSNPVQSAMSLKARFRSYGLDEESVQRLASSIENLPVAPNFYLRVEFEDPQLRNDAPWRAGVSAVVEESDGTKSYWALAHPPGDPDFHDEAGFLLELPASPDAPG
jgi:hypothetical protein